MTDPAEEAKPAGELATLGGQFRRAQIVQNIALPAFIALLMLVTGSLEPRFWSGENLSNLARQIAPLAILAVGEAFAVISGGLDLSVAAILALAGIVGVLVMNSAGVVPGLAAMIVTGAAIGAANGLIITRFQVSPFIVTLGMLSVAQGVALAVTGGLPIYDMPESFVSVFGNSEILGVPMAAVIAIVVLLAGATLLHRTVFGRYIYAIGSNPVAAHNSGVRVRRQIFLVYVLTGTTAGIGAIVLTSWVSAAQPLAGGGLELKSLAAVVIGGAALSGGVGTMWGVFLGVVILGMLSNALNMLGVSSFYQTLAIGIVIVVAVILDRIRRNGDALL